jgi:deoxyribonuclease-4
MLGLNAMEVQFVRVNTMERYATDDDAGLLPQQVEGELVVEILRENKKGDLVPSVRKGQKLKDGDTLRTLTCGIGSDFHELRDTGKLAKELDVELSVHTPYYMDLSGEEEIASRSIANVVYGGIIADAVGAHVVVTHMGLYGTMDSKEATKAVVKRMTRLVKEFQTRGIKARIGLETSGKQMVYGSLDEVLEVVQKARGTVPVLNFPHIHARGHGSLQSKEDFQEVFDRTRKASRLNWFYTHFSGVQHEGGNEKRYTPIKKGDLKFEPLAECILDNDYNVTVISGSPLLEHDAMYMKVILERILLKREGKLHKTLKEASR